MDAFVRENKKLVSEARELRNEIKRMQELKFQLEKGVFSNDPAADKVEQLKSIYKTEQDRNKKVASK